MRIPVPPAKDDKVWGLSLVEWDPMTLIRLGCRGKDLNKVGKEDEMLNQAIMEVHWEG